MTDNNSNPFIRPASPYSSLYTAPQAPVAPKTREELTSPYLAYEERLRKAKKEQEQIEQSFEAEKQRQVDMEEERKRREAPPQEFFSDLETAKQLVYVRFKEKVRIPGSVATQAFGLIDPNTGKVNTSGINTPFFLSLAYMLPDGSVKMWHKRTGNIFRVPQTNVGSYLLLSDIAPTERDKLTKLFNEVKDIPAPEATMTTQAAKPGVFQK